MLVATTRISILRPSRHNKKGQNFAVFEGSLLYDNLRVLSFEIFENLALGFLQNLFLVFNVILRSKPFSIISSTARGSKACPEFKSESSKNSGSFFLSFR